VSPSAEGAANGWPPGSSPGAVRLLLGQVVVPEVVAGSIVQPPIFRQNCAAVASDSGLAKTSPLALSAASMRPGTGSFPVVANDATVRRSKAVGQPVCGGAAPTGAAVGTAADVASAAVHKARRFARISPRKWSRQRATCANVLCVTLGVKRT
jgi:hypothetical protein